MDDNLLILKIAKLYYQENFSRIEIAEKMRLNRFRVSKLLKDALDEKIVEIIIHESSQKSSYIDLENLLEKKFKLNRAVVIESSKNYEETKKNIGKAAADLFLDLIQDNDIIGIDCGATVFEMINALPYTIDKKNIKIVQLNGGLSQMLLDFNSIDIAQKLAKIFNANCYRLHSPAVVKNQKTRELLLEEDNIKETIEMYKKINMAVVGIGSMNMFERYNFEDTEDFKKQLEENAVGIINFNFYDKEGNQVVTSLNKRIIGMDLETLKNIDYRIGVAGFKSKADAIYGALKGKLINIIVTDKDTAMDILER